MKKMMLADMRGALTRAEMKKIMAGDDEQDLDDGAPCLNSGSVCKKNSRCCSKSCADNGMTGTKYCDGA